jgi:hypothetical protein
MLTLLCPLESKILPFGPQLRRFAGVYIYEHLLLRSREHWQNSSLSLTCYSTLDFNYELEIYARQHFPFFKLVPTFEHDDITWMYTVQYEQRVMLNDLDTVIYVYSTTYDSSIYKLTFW